ncbi:Transcription termination factor MTERF8, chloroplastic [Vitis vinifera]|uniref:Transcription termination factor MTERF8, chloroplastic n=1 Tax=Vitis vinifera TaxID=29760 RepID=A0A438KLT2_VITVI|nr:Transcription termination factor MTERF8, chloroplastic [Vitis vinifera]
MASPNPKPQLLVSDPDKSLLPKLHFFYSKGASNPDVVKIIASCPVILKRSLENQIIPSFNFFKDFFQSEEMTMATVKRFSRVLIVNPHICVESNINALQESGVPKSNIAALLSLQPRAFMVRPNHFREILEEVKKMGFDPSKTRFPTAVQAMTGMSKSTWERKIDAYKRWGWSEEDIWLAFTKSPWCMIYSEDKIMATMDFFVNKMGRESSLIANRPFLIGLSLEKRIIPRYSVVQVLLSKGLIDKDISLVVLFESTEKMFLEKFVNGYKEEAPQLLNLYQEKVNLSG